MLSNLNIRTKLIAAFTVLLVLMGVIFVISYNRIGTINEKMNEITDVNAVQLQIIGDIEVNLMEIKVTQKRLLQTDDEKEKDAFVRFVENETVLLNNNIDALDKSIVDDATKVKIQELRGKINEFLTINKTVTQLSGQNSETIAAHISENESAIEFSKLKTTLDELIVRLGSSVTAQKIYQLKAQLAELKTTEHELIEANTEEAGAMVIRQAGEIENQIESLATSIGASLNGEAKALFDRYQTQYAVFYNVHLRVRDLGGKNTNTRAEAISESDMEEVDEAADLVLGDIEANIEAEMANDTQVADELYSTAVRTMIIIILVSVLLGSLIAIWLLKDIVSSLNIAKTAIKKVAAGDFSADVQADKDDEIGDMLKELQVMVVKLRNSVDVAKLVSKGDLTIDFSTIKNKGGDLDEALENMVNNLREIATTIYNGAENVSAASQQVASASQQMSQGAQEQASASEEVSSSMEQMVANIQQNTDNSRETEKIANKAAKDIQVSSESVSETVEAITNIAEKIAIIEEIASKTDLLALNAAVEAARAGEHGKGFAVVAAEVRKLAERSQKAAAEITEISSKTVKAAQQSKELLLNTLPDINKTAQLVQEIAAASVEQNTGADQVNGAIQQLSQVTQGNASAAEEMSSNAEELNGQAEELKAAVSYFKLDNRGSSRVKVKSTLSRKPVKGNYKEAVTSTSSNGNGHAKGFDLKLEDGPSDTEFTDF
ncbi:MAG TPA: methyl-accepting chemotaxis protein [Ohtaekwangia sp.]